MPIENPLDTATLPQGTGFGVARTAQGITLTFPVLRAPGAALGLLAFSMLCGAMPAVGLSALLPLEAGNASAVVSLALIGGFAAPFILASLVFAVLAIYLLTNALRVDISAGGVRSERRVFGYVTQRREIARADIAGVEPRISARFQNVFSATPRYALIAKHVSTRNRDVTVAEDVIGQPLMIEMQALICITLDIK